MPQGDISFTKDKRVDVANRAHCVNREIPQGVTKLDPKRFRAQWQLLPLWSINSQRIAVGILAYQANLILHSW